MNKKTMAFMLAMLMLLTVGCGRKAQETQPVQTEPITEPAATETTEMLPPGVEKSIFDEIEETQAEKPQESSQPQQQETEPEETKETSSGKQETSATNPPQEQPAEALTEYEKFHAKSPADQQAYMESFSSIEEFFAWYNAAQEEYEQKKPPVEIGNGQIDLGELLGGNG